MRGWKPAAYRRFGQSSYSPTKKPIQMDDWRKLLALAIRAAHRSVNNATPQTRLKRHRVKLQKLTDGLAVASEVASCANPDSAVQRKLARATNAVQSVYDDVQYGPNDLELATGDVHPAASVLAVLRAAMDAAFWHVARIEGKEYAIAQCSSQFAQDIGHALQAGVTSGDDERLVDSVDWSDGVFVEMLIGSDGLLGPRAAPSADLG